MFDDRWIALTNFIGFGRQLQKSYNIIMFAVSRDLQCRSATGILYMCVGTILQQDLYYLGVSTHGCPYQCCATCFISCIRIAAILQQRLYCLSVTSVSRHHQVFLVYSHMFQRNWETLPHFVTTLYTTRRLTRCWTPCSL